MLRLAKRAAKRIIVDQLDRRLRTSKATMLFVYGHMRSGSSLLVHILNTNPEVIGFGETHYRYRNPRDFSLSAFDILRSFSRLRLRERYVLDKVLGRKLGPSTDLLMTRSTKVILLVRRPEETLPSILDLGLENQSTPVTALANYRERLEDIRRLASSLPPDRWAFVQYEHLLESPPQTLKGLTAFLKLNQPLSERYDRIWSTGKRRIGDPSPVISTGRIVKVPRTYQHEVSESLMIQARTLYDDCLSTLRALSSLTEE